MSLILGIDPGSRVTGYGVIRVANKTPVYVASGCIRTNATTLVERLLQIFDGISEVIQQYQPTTAAIEQVFMHQNPNSAIKLGQARGVAILALARAQLSVVEFSAREIKQAVTGYGGAEKDQIQQMIQRLLKLNGTPQVDAADALAVAICAANSSSY